MTDEVRAAPSPASNKFMIATIGAIVSIVGGLLFVGTQKSAELGAVNVATLPATQENVKNNTEDIATVAQNTRELISDSQSRSDDNLNRRINEEEARSDDQVEWTLRLLDSIVRREDDLDNLRAKKDAEIRNYQDRITESLQSDVERLENSQGR